MSKEPEKPRLFQERRRMTRLAEATAGRIMQLGLPIISDYQIFYEIWKIYKEGSVRYLRGNFVTQELFVRTRRVLRQENIIRYDNDYSGLWRVVDITDAPADEIVCVADNFCYISHISALQRYGLTERRPGSLHITQPDSKTIRSMIQNTMIRDFGEDFSIREIFIQPLYVTHHPPRVRRRPVETFSTKHYGEWRKVRGTQARIATIGQTFLDMLSEPKRCGGMLHVLETWDEHAKTYLEEIIARVDTAPQPIQKVRAGYILEERLGLSDPRISAWRTFAQRGGSRVLDPGAPFVEKHSENWMISINVG